MPRLGPPATRVQRTPLGARIHELRGGITLRSLAKELGIDFTYLSKIENGADVPSEDTLRKIASWFKADADELLALAGKVPPALAERARTEHQMGRLLRRLPNLPPDKMREIYRVADLEDADADTH